MNKKVQYTVMLIFAIGIAILIYFFDSAPPSFEFHKQFYKRSYSGIVQEVFIDANNHQNKTIICVDLDDKKDEFKVLTPDGNRRLYEVVNYGDTINKRSNSNEIFVFGSKGHITIKYELRYPK